MAKNSACFLSNLWRVNCNGSIWSEKVLDFGGYINNAPLPPLPGNISPLAPIISESFMIPSLIPNVTFSGVILR